MVIEAGRFKDVTGNLTCDYSSPGPEDAGFVNTVSGTASGQCAGLVQS